jgi:hypothetical protein
MFQENGRRKRIKGEIKCSKRRERTEQRIHFELKMNRRSREISICNLQREFTTKIIEDENRDYTSSVSILEIQIISHLYSEFGPCETDDN